MIPHIRSVGIEFVPNLQPDFVLGESCCAIFVQVNYHMLHPEYLSRRIREVGRGWKLRLIVCLVDAEERNALVEINKMALLNDYTLLLAWSWEEAARYLETFKVLENKPPTSIQQKTTEDYLAQLSDTLGCVRSVNKSDASVLASNFGTLRALANATREELALCPGLGDKKVERLYNAFHAPFRSSRAKQAAAPSLITNKPDGSKVGVSEETAVEAQDPNASRAISQAPIFSED